MKYYTSNNIKIIECSPSEFSVVYVNKAKKNITTADTYVNANFFAANQKLNNESFTLPVNHLICDYEIQNGCGCDIKNKQRGKFINNKYYYDSYNYGCKGDQFYNKPLTTFIIDNNKPKIEDVETLNTSWKYAISGIPIMKDGNDVKWLTYVKKQGWTGGELYSTYHIFIGLKKNSDIIYIMDYCTTGSNCIYNGSAYKKFKEMGFNDVIKLDGGGSCIMKYKGQIKQSTSENRKINAIIKINGKEEKLSSNPYPIPTRTIYYKNPIMNGNDVKWIQYQLNKDGCDCGKIDGSFGNCCKNAVIKFQKKYKLEIDGSVGVKTREKLKNV